MGLRVGVVFALFIAMAARTLHGPRIRASFGRTGTRSSSRAPKPSNAFVILDLEAVWCHWCHVMEKTTYKDAKVVALLKSKYLPVRVDQDANPDLSNRYGDWGWPATIIFAPDGTEIVKRRGYLPPERYGIAARGFYRRSHAWPFGPLFAGGRHSPPKAPLLAKSQRDDLFDAARMPMTPSTAAGTPYNKFIDTESMDLAARRCGEGRCRSRRRRRGKRSMSALNLIDRRMGRHLSVFR